MRKRPFVKAGKPAGNGLLLGYARVSKGDDQTNTLQARALSAAGCRRIFEEAASGGRWDRPELHRIKGDEQSNPSFRNSSSSARTRPGKPGRFSRVQTAQTTEDLAGKCAPTPTTSPCLLPPPGGA